MNECTYCKKTYNNEQMTNSTIWAISVENGSSEFPAVMSIEIDNTYNYEGTKASIEIEINFCPMCGKNLEKKESRG